MKGFPIGILAFVLSALPLLQCDALTDSTAVRTSMSAIEEPIARYRSFTSLNSVANHPSITDPVSPMPDNVSDSVLDKRRHAHALLQEVLRAQRFLESLDALSEIDLPLGVVKSGGALDYTILVDRMQFTREGALMDVYASLALPQTGARIAFHGQVPLSAKGGIVKTAKVFLLGDHTMKLDHNTLVTLKGSDRSYVEFDCTGFLGINLDAELQFSTDLLVPENEHGEPESERLKVSFTTYTHSLNDMMLQVTIPPFQVKGLKGFGFHVSKAYLDWSDLLNPPGLVFPEHYPLPILSAGLDNLWRGIFLHELEVRFPPAFSRGNTTERISVGAKNIVLDGLGVTGELYVENIFRDGNMNGWRYSLDKVGLILITNKVAGFSMEGNLAIPVVKAKDGTAAEFKYIAYRGVEGEYIFSVAIQDELKLDLWLADLRLKEGSSVVVREEGNRFYPAAHLNGELSIAITGKGPNATFNSIRFENMVIDSKPPYFQPGTFALGREGHSSSILKYPIVFDNIRITSEDARVGIAFDLTVNLSGKPEDESFAGKGALTIWGVQDNPPPRDKDGKPVGIDRGSWRHDRVELSSLKVKIKKPKVVELSGELRFFDDDNIYGEGFKGALTGSIHTIHVEAQALFGRTESFRYWYADALMEMKTGVPIFPGALSAFGFGGGYYSRMKQTPKPIEQTLGKSPSGIVYVPDANAIGIRAIVLIGTPRPEAMRGDVALEVNLNTHGGINSVTFTGNANFMSPLPTGAKQIRELTTAAVAGELTEKLASITKGQVSGSIRLHFDHLNDVFHGNMEIYVNVAGGIVRGVSEGNKAGWAVLHFEKHNWYIHIGTPDQPIGLEVARIFKAKSYFMLGKNIPGSPPPPPQVTEILGEVDLDYMRDLNALESGMGIAFGLHFLVDTGDLRFLMFYGRFSAGTGIDFMLKDYGNEYHCAGSSDVLGINGWYANGQAYAFVTGTIGIRINLLFYKGKYEILSLGAAAVMQAKGPNPFWMKGTVGGYYRILGGLVKGRCKFEVTVGKECKPVASENLLEKVNMIAEITPANTAINVSVFNSPQALFNIPVGEVFQIRDMESNTHYFRAVLDEFAVSVDNQPVTGTLIWNDEKDVVAFDPTDLLPGEKTVTAKVRLSFEERVNGAWTRVRLRGEEISENAESTFETGTTPDHIPETNIAFSYPMPDQVNFLTAEYGQGFIQLHNGQPDLLQPGEEWTQKIVITDRSSGAKLTEDIYYDANSRQIRFNIPQGLQPSTRYFLQIIHEPRDVRNVDANVRSVDQEIAMNTSGGSATITTQAAEGTLDQLESKEIFSTSFHTSRFRTFVEKMQSIHLSPVIRLSAGINIFRLTAFLEGEEFFDNAEAGLANTGFVRMEAALTGNTWYEQYVYPLLYDGYPLLGWMKVRRPDPERLGIPPVRDVRFGNIKANTGSLSPVPFGSESLVYNLGESVASDYYDLQRHAVNYLADHPTLTTPRIQALATQALPHLRYGSYRVRFSYVIPGIEKTTSSYEMEIFNRVPDTD